MLVGIAPSAASRSSEAALFVGRLQLPSNRSPVIHSAPLVHYKVYSLLIIGAQTILQ